MTILPQKRAISKILLKGGQKLRWCPKTGAGAKKLSRGGQKLRWCPKTGAGTKKLTTAGQKRAFVPTKPGTNHDFWPRWPKKAVCARSLAKKGRLCPQPGQKRLFVPAVWPKKAVCAPKPGQERKT
ncbi:MAG: hypothetical protein QM296_12945 [Bacillota bacterium]|nr:hypothetical protein [Bacillota bacterium]